MRLLIAGMLVVSALFGSDAGVGLQGSLGSLSYFVGHWSCDGAFSNGQKIHSTLAFQPELGGAWLALRADDAPPNEFHALELWGHPEDVKDYQNVIFDNFKGMRPFTSSGWTGDQWIWAGPSERFVFARKAARAFDVSWEVARPDAGWAVGDKLRCQREG
jgi:hypothetical protein